jgi:hypothetical protein
MEKNMSEYTTKDAVQYAVDGEATKFKTAVDQMLMQKVGDALQLQRMNLAQSVLEPAEDLPDEDIDETETEEPEGSEDETVQ